MLYSAGGPTFEVLPLKMTPTLREGVVAKRVLYVGLNEPTHACGRPQAAAFHSV